MSSRKILSLSSTYDAYIFPDLPLQERPVIGITTTESSELIYGEDGNVIDEKTLYTEHLIFDETWEPEEPSIYLTVKDDRKYYSIHSAYTLEELESTFDPEIDEKPLFDLQIHPLEFFDSSFTDDVLDNNLFVLNKYNQDTNYLNYLGIPGPTDPDKYLENNSQVGIATT